MKYRVIPITMAVQKKLPFSAFHKFKKRGTHDSIASPRKSLSEMKALSCKYWPRFWPSKGIYGHTISSVWLSLFYLFMVSQSFIHSLPYLSRSWKRRKRWIRCVIIRFSSAITTIFNHHDYDLWLYRHYCLACFNSLRYANVYLRWWHCIVI